VRTRKRKGGHASRLVPLDEPRAVEVRVDDRGVPVAVASERRFLAVEAVRESWRIDDEWWRRPITRSYHDLVLEVGALVTIYRDLEDGRWYSHG
jgi:hypothetical protein